MKMSVLKNRSNSNRSLISAQCNLNKLLLLEHQEKINTKHISHSETREHIHDHNEGRSSHTTNDLTNLPKAKV